MSGYVKSWTYEADFDGDHVVFRLRPLTRAQVIDFASLDVVSPGVESRAAQFYATVVSQQVESVTGLRDAAGAAIDLETLLRDAYFSQLVFQVGAELMRAAAPANPTSPGSQPETASPGVGSGEGTTGEMVG